MKVKATPEDFQVVEVADATTTDGGRYALYRLEKRGLGTLESLRIIARRWKVTRQRMSFGGLKDRQAVTTQHLTILGGPERDLTHPGVRLTHLGWRPEPFRSSDIVANRFKIVVRGLEPRRVATALADGERVGRDGLPNYFDDQRFASVSTGGDFIARAWLGGDWEEAVRLAFARASPGDGWARRREKELVRRRWGRFELLQDRRLSGDARRVFGHLTAHPDDWRGAFGTLPGDLLALWLAAFQSHLWNLLLVRWLAQIGAADWRRPLSLLLGAHPLVRFADAGSRARIEVARLPYAAPDARVEDPVLGPLMERILLEHDLDRERLRLDFPPGYRLAGGERAAFIRPRELTIEAGDDEATPGRRRITLEFELPPGSYATLVVACVVGRDTGRVSSSRRRGSSR